MSKARLIGMAALCAAALAGAAPTGAQAGTYTVHQCNYPGYPQRATSNWGVSASFANTGSGNSCTGSAGGTLAAHHNQGTNAMPENSSLVATMAIPADRPNVTIASSKVIYSALAASGSPDFLSAGSGGTNDLNYQVNGGASQATWSWSPPAGARSLYLGIYCGGGPLGPCNFGQYTNTVRIHGAEFVLEESQTPPQPTIDGGSLLSSGARKGTESVDYNATDPDSGVAKVDVRLGSTRVGGDDFTTQSARCPYVDWNACARDTGQQAAPVDTTLVPDGTHNLTVTATDAAGNTRSASGAQVTVDNVPDPGATGGGGGTQGGSGGAAPAARTPNGVGGGPGSKLSALDKRSRRGVKAKANQPARVKGRLLNRHDLPVSNARITVLEQEVGSSAVREVGQVTTGADGRFTYVAPAGRTRKLLFGYRSHVEDEDFTSIAHVRINSVAVVMLRLSVGRTRPGVPLALTGTVIGRPYPRRGVLVAFQGRARGSKKWLTFATARTDSRGRFRSGYRFRSYGRFELRAVAKADSGWRYTPGVSVVRRVFVR